MTRLGVAAAVRVHEAAGDRDHLRTLLGLARVGGRLLPNQEPQAAGGVLAALHRHAWRAGLIVPAAEGTEILAGRLGETGDELLDGGRLAVVPGEIEVHAALKA